MELVCAIVTLRSSSYKSKFSSSEKTWYIFIIFLCQGQIYHWLFHQPVPTCLTTFDNLYIHHFIPCQDQIYCCLVHLQATRAHPNTTVTGWTQSTTLTTRRRRIRSWRSPDLEVTCR